jgi:hypothetical protein
VIRAIKIKENNHRSVGPNNDNAFADSGPQMTPWHRSKKLIGLMGENHSELKTLFDKHLMRWSPHKRQNLADDMRGLVDKIQGLVDHCTKSFLRSKEKAANDNEILREAAE